MSELINKCVHGHLLETRDCIEPESLQSLRDPYECMNSIISGEVFIIFQDRACLDSVVDFVVISAKRETDRDVHSVHVCVYKCGSNIMSEITV